MMQMNSLDSVPEVIMLGSEYEKYERSWYFVNVRLRFLLHVEFRITITVFISIMLQVSDLLAEVLCLVTIRGEIITSRLISIHIIRTTEVLPSLPLCVFIWILWCIATFLGACL